MKLFPDAWDQAPVNTLCNEVVDCVNKTAPVLDGPTEFKMIRTTNVKGGRINLEECRYVDEPTFAKWTRRVTPRREDIVLTREAPLGEVGLLRSDEKVFLGQRTMLYRASPRKLDQRFLYYSMLGPLVQGQIRAKGSGATVEHLRVPDAETFLVAYPPLREQRQIAAILSAYDDLIANNLRRIVLLESMAEEIYREWFVRMRFPEWANSPTDKGIPKNWSRKTINSLLAESKRPIKKSDLSTVDRYVGLEHIPRRTAVLDAWGQPDSVDSDKLRFSEGDILFGKIRPYLHKIAMAPFSGACSTDTIVLKSRHADFLLFAYFTVSSNTFVDLAAVASKGTKMPRADWHFLKEVEVTTPPDCLLRSFNAVTKPLIDTVVTLLKMNSQLAESRGALLPRLISGKLCVDHLSIQTPPSMRAETAQAA